MTAKRSWTGYEIEALRAQYANTLTATIAATLGRTPSSTHQKAIKLGLSKSAEFIANASRARMTPEHPARAEQFAKGHKTWNAGIAFDAGGRSAETRFRPGNVPQTWLPVGSQRLDKDGLLELKFADLPGKDGWIHAHRKAWEDINGPVPAGLIVVFKPGRRTAKLDEITADAVEAIDRAELMRRNTYHRFGPEIAKVIQLRGAINRQINKRTKEGSHA